MQLLVKLREAADLAPDLVYAVLVSLFWVFHPRRRTRIVVPRGGGIWWVWTPEESYYSVRGALWRGSAADNQSKFERYTHSDFVTVGEGDTVVDVGAFLGEFSIPATKRAARVLSIEPNPSTYRCLSKRLEATPNASAVQALPSNENTVVSFHAGSDPSESSILGVDLGSSERIQIEARTLESILEDCGVVDVDFLKLDAEGAEPEVLEGLGDIRPAKIAVDAGDERFGETTIREVTELLEGRGYVVKVRGSVVFARLGDIL